MVIFFGGGLLLAISLLLPVSGQSEETQLAKQVCARGGSGPGKVVQSGKDHRQGLKQITRRKSSMNNVKDYGAVGDGKTKDTPAIQKAIDTGGIVFFPPGVYLSGTLYLKSNGGLDLAPGAVLLASPDKGDYNADNFCEQNNVFSREHVSGAHFIVAVEQKNIVIRGEKDLLPLFVPDGTVVPLDQNGSIEIRKFGTKPGRFMLYEDDGETFGYKQGEYHWTELKA